MWLNMHFEQEKVNSLALAPAIGAEELLSAWLVPPAVRRMPPVKGEGLQAVLFDLDGVLVDTAEFHYLSWKQLAEELGVHFDRHANEGFRGVGRMECLEKLLGQYRGSFVGEEKRLLAERKNGYYMAMVETLTPGHVAAGGKGLLVRLHAAGVRTAVVSASRNARRVLEKLGLTEWFDLIVDGGMVTRGKPDPEGFLLAAEKLRARAAGCVVVEDAESGIEAARRAGMKCVGISAQRSHAMTGATMVVGGVGRLTVERLAGLVTGGVVARAG